jgi:DNA ligase-1
MSDPIKRPRDLDDDEDKEQQELSALTKTIPTSMAKLYLKELPLDAFKNPLWPRPTLEGAVAEPGSMPYAVVADTFADISAVGSRLECTKMLALLFYCIIKRSPSDLLPAVYLTINKQGPAHEGLELGIGDALLLKVVAEVCGLTEARAKEEYKKTGDLAEVAQNGKQKVQTLVKPKPLTVVRVFKTFREVSTMSGKDVMRRRHDLLKALIRDAKGPEINFIVRALQCKMRMGLAEPTVLVALGHAFALQHHDRFLKASSSPEALQASLNLGAENVARLYHTVPSLEIVIPAVLQHGFELLVPTSDVAKAVMGTLAIRPGLPVRPQLAHPTNGISTILDRFQGKEFTCEYKYDGERAQIHYKAGSGLQIFSRNSETHTTKYPDIIQMLPTVFDSAKVTSFIIDSEVVAVDSETGALKAFQVLQHRGRKNIDIKDVTIRVCVFAFDIMYLNDKPLIDLTLAERRQILFETFLPRPGTFQFAQHMNSSEVEDMQKFLNQSIADGCEGLMVKSLKLESNYSIAKRSHFWLKLKKDYMDGATDTLDLVPIGAYFGKGKRTGVYGGFLLACYDPDSDEYQSICKIGTGFQDDMLEQLTEQLSPHAVSAMPPFYRTSDKPDVWLSETQVWEVKAADLSISPVHCAAYGLVDASRGIALRFPRFLKIRDDKGPTDATTAQQVADMYRQQALALAPGQAADD